MSRSKHHISQNGALWCSCCKETVQRMNGRYVVDHTGKHQKWVCFPCIDRRGNVLDAEIFKSI